MATARVKVKTERDPHLYLAVLLDGEEIGRVALKPERNKRYRYYLKFKGDRFATFDSLGALKAYVAEVGREFFLGEMQHGD